MEFSFKNLGIIKDANIQLNGLTVLTGLNDTGKSFISKAIYSIIKTVNEANEQAIAEKYEKTRTNINQIFSLHRQIVPFTQQKMQTFNPNEINTKILSYLISDSSTDNSIKAIQDYTNKVVADLKDFSLNTPSRPNIEGFIKRIKDISADLQVVILDVSDNEKKFKYFFDSIIIEKLFQGQLNNLNEKDSVLNIKLTEGATELLEVSIKDNKAQSFNLKNIMLLTDATLIETPTIFQISKFITTNLAYPTVLKKVYPLRSDLPYTYYDLLEKMNLSSNVTDIHADIFNGISKIIGGQLAYNLEEGSFIFKKENGNEIKAFNIATGIKSLGLIQLLINSGAINKNSVLIIDEPEVHLHPKWEIEYAKVICELSKFGIKILISSHSPYLLRAIRKYTKEDEKVENITTFYFGKKINGQSSFENITENPEPIFKTLAEPMMSLS